MSRPPRNGPPPPPPPQGRPGGVWHHAIRGGLLLGLAVLTTLLFPPDPRLRMEQYSPGMIASADITAEVEFDVPVNSDELAAARTEARLSVPPTLDFHSEAEDSTVARLERFFAGLTAARAQGQGQAVQRFLEDRSIAATPAQVRLVLTEGTLDQLRSAALRGARENLRAGVVDGADLSGSASSSVTIRDLADDSERSVDRAMILTTGEFLDRVGRLLPEEFPPDGQQLLRLVLVQHMRASLELNEEATELNRNLVAQAVPTTKQTVPVGEPVVRANEPITPEVMERINAYEAALQSQDLLGENANLRLLPLAGSALLNLLILGIFWSFIHFFRVEVYDRTRWVILVAILIAVYLGGASVVIRSGWPVEALPVVFSALAVAVLWDGRMALVLAMTLAVLSSVQSGLQGLHVLVPTFVGGAAAGMSVRVVRRRAQTWVFIALIFAAYTSAILALALLLGRELESMGLSLVAAGANAVVSAILAMGFIPVFEMITGITTDQTLLEWGDPNRPLLRRLSMEAPGTYAHTINVANLAEAAASAIGANGLLSRVGLYYHDVGKMLKPHYYVENQPDGRNPHDRLKPDTSAAIVREHITEGYRLAREEKVPKVIADFILEHHGTQRIGFFWDRAVEEYGEDALDPEDYRYPGPKPRSRETAIAMLADSVESATRALQDPSPDRIRHLIDSIVERKISQGQLDDAPLTLQEVTRIKDQFVKVLSGVYHHRIDYPETKHLTEAPERGGESGGGTPPAPANSRAASSAPAPSDDAGGSKPRSQTRRGSRPRKPGGPDHPELPLDGGSASGPRDRDS